MPKARPDCLAPVYDYLLGRGYRAEGVFILVERKKRHRRRLAALPFEEKTEIAFRLRERRKFMRAAADEQRRGEAEPGRGDKEAGRRGE